MKVALMLKIIDEIKLNIYINEFIKIKKNFNKNELMKKI